MFHHPPLLGGSLGALGAGPELVETVDRRCLGFEEVQSCGDLTPTTSKGLLWLTMA